jgi:hypothetical protein
MVKSLDDKVSSIRMTEIRSGSEPLYSHLGPLQELARYLGLRAYTPKGHRISKKRKRYHGQMKLITFVKQTGEQVYERTYWEKTGESVRPAKKHYNFEIYKGFNPNYDLTN